MIARKSIHSDITCPNCDADADMSPDGNFICYGCDYAVDYSVI